VTVALGFMDRVWFGMILVQASAGMCTQQLVQHVAILVGLLDPCGLPKTVCFVSEYQIFGPGHHVIMCSYALV